MSEDAYLLFFEGDGDVGVGGEADLAAFDAGDEGVGDIMMMALVAALPAIGLGELDPVALDAVNGADMDAIGADHFGMFLYG